MCKVRQVNLRKEVELASQHALRFEKSLAGHLKIFNQSPDHRASRSQLSLTNDIRPAFSISCHLPQNLDILVLLVDSIKTLYVLVNISSLQDPSLYNVSLKQRCKNVVLFAVVLLSHNQFLPVQKLLLCTKIARHQTVTPICIVLIDDPVT